MLNNVDYSGIINLLSYVRKQVGSICIVPEGLRRYAAYNLSLIMKRQAMLNEKIGMKVNQIDTCVI
jgi:hypothetical protein